MSKYLKSVLRTKIEVNLHIKIRFPATSVELMHQ